MRKPLMMMFASLVLVPALAQSSATAETFGTGMGLWSNRYGVGTAFWRPETGQGVVMLNAIDRAGAMTLTGRNNNHREVLIISTETIQGDEITYRITYRTEDGAAFLPSGYTFGGETVNILYFSLARSFAFNDKLEGSTPGIIAGIRDPQTAGAGTPGNLGDDRYRSTLELFDSDGDLVGVTSFTTRFNGTGISGFDGFEAPNIANLDIASATVTIRATANPVCPDSDNDGVCDVDDVCPGFDDNIDSDGDGIPDGCDPVVPGDLDDDGDVDLDDYNAFLAAYGSSSGDPNFLPAADFDGDDFVGMPDFGIWYAHYLAFANGE